MTLHGSVVASAGRGALILGRSGAGKSTLLLDMIALGADLVADDRVILTASDDLHACAPSRLAGLVEARGWGLLSLPYLKSSPISLVVHLDQDAVERVPLGQEWTYEGITVPLFPGRNVVGLAARVLLCLRHANAVSAGRDAGLLE